jgi:hypothetical protein
MLTKLFTRFPAYTVVEKPTSKVVARYRDQVPADLLELWEQYGFGTFCDSYLKVVNPDDYAELLADTYQLTSTVAPALPLVLFTTAMGDLLVWELDCLSLLDYRHGSTNVVAQNFKVFFRNLTYDSFLNNTLRWEPYPAARERLGEPAFDECFGYVPALALGGPETADHLQKVKLREHIYLLSQLTGRLER